MTMADEAQALTPDEFARDGDPSTSAADSPGQQLRRAREARGLDISQLATSLRIAPQVVEALEQDDYAQLPSAVFVSGYIRSYARLVGLDPEPLNQRFRRLHPNAEPPPRHVARSEREEAEHEGGGLGVYLVTVLVILALVAGAYGWWVSRPDQSQIPPEQAATPPSSDRTSGAPLPGSADDDRPLEQPSLPAQAPSAETDTTAGLESGSDAGSMRASDQRTDSPTAPQLTSPDVVVAEQGDQRRASTSGLTSDAPTRVAAETAADAMSESMVAPSDGNAIARAPVSATLPRPASPEDERLAIAQATPSSAEDTTTGVEAETATDATTDTAAATTTADANSLPVELSFSGTCWVDIRDSTGEVLLFGEMSRGDRERLGGEPPYSLVIGNAAAAELTVAGQPYDLDSVARGNVARFQLDPSAFSAQSANPNSDTAVDPND